VRKAFISSASSSSVPHSLPNVGQCADVVGDEIGEPCDHQIAGEVVGVAVLVLDVVVEPVEPTFADADQLACCPVEGERASG
jgi:hypothetical protein